ncbi:MAG: hyperosmotically inducible periplasmic protein [Verrucomicrobiota bacterium]|jgi:osmotically-inducible protein OsmY
MKKSLLIFLVGAAAGAAGFWFFEQTKTKAQLSEAKDRVTFAAWKAGKSIQEFAGEIKQELSHSGQVVREKARGAGESISATAVTASIKAKLLTESGLRSVGVETTDGVVTLTGDVATHEDIARAMKIALETDGVQKVVSKIQVTAGK